MKTVLLVDGHSLIYRSFFALVRRPLRNSKGMNTSAVFGFANTLRKLLREFEPEYCAVVYDAPGRTFRHERYEQYKIQRPPVPEELPGQIPVVKKMVEAWGIAGFEVAGVEADDVIGSLARKLSNTENKVVIATSDKDLLQLVGTGVSVYDPWKELCYESKDVKEKLGVEPSQVCDFLALTGDSTDNVPGVPGIGPRRAVEILGRYGSLEAALRNEPRLSGHDEVARLSRGLVEIDTKVEVDAEPEDLKPRGVDRSALHSVFQAMEFASLLGEFAPDEPEPVSVAPIEAAVLDRIGGRFAFCYRAGQGLWVSPDGRRTYYVDGSDIAAIRRLLTNPGSLKVGCRIKEQLKALRLNGLALEPPLFDVGVGAWLMDPNRHGYDVADVVNQVLGRAIAPVLPEAEPVQVFELYRTIEPQVAAMGLERAMDELEMPLIPVLVEMERRGVAVDTGYLAGLGQELAAEEDLLARRISKLAGASFNPASPKQLAEVLFERLKLHKGRRTKTGHSTSSDILEALVEQHPIVGEVLRFRELAKLRSTYIGPLLGSAAPKTSRVHAEFNQTGTATGRLSSSKPNLQNIPVRSELGRRIRRAFVAESGHLFISADYSQIELRVMAHMSGDQELTQAFGRGEDIHARTAAAVFGANLPDVTPEQRRLAKMVNYGLIYGMGDFGLSSRLGIPIEQARSFLDEYMHRFSGVAEWRERTVERTRTDGFVRTIAGRIRPLPGILSTNRAVVEAARRAALNAPIQGSAADIVKTAMLRAAGVFAEGRLEGGMVAQVHDELLFEVKENQAERAKAVLKHEMENAWRLDVPLVVTVGVGSNWDEAH